MKRYFRIGAFAFKIEYKDEIVFPENLLKFETADESSEYTYHLRYGDQFPEPVGSLIADRMDLKVYEKDGLEMRYIGIKGSEEFYACYQEISEMEAEVIISATQTRYLNIDPVFTSLFAFERKLNSLGSIVLHCAYMELDGEAVLFSAPSETGKTTQANLWQKYRGTRTINGDRSLLGKVDGRWHAGGWPVCGTSEICNNISMPIRAIVMLSQARENSVEKLHPMKAFSQVYSQITINRWNNEAHGVAMDLIEKLISEVPVYHLACNISEDAVKCLEEVIG